MPSNSLIYNLKKLVVRLGEDIGAIQRLSIITTGRPDIISSIPNGLQEKVNRAPNGCIFTSIDGAKVGAYQWVKTSDGWKVITADTGWRRLLTKLPFTTNVAGFDVRRVNNNIYARIAPINNPSGFTLTTPTTKSRVDLNLPEGFILVTRTTTAIYNDNGITGYMLIRKGDGSPSYGGADVYISSKTTNAILCAWSASWIASDDYPKVLPGTLVD